jgi:hypothetical protein
MIRHSLTKTVRGLAFGVFCLTALVLMGCKSQGTVHGTVTYGNQKIRVGRVSVVVSNAQPQSAIIKDDGTYEITGVPVGEGKVVVESREPVNPTMGGGGKTIESMPPEMREKMGNPQKKYQDALAKWIKIPDKYADQNKTPLNLEVKSGDNEFNINLQD